MIINENKQLTENFFEEIIPKYARICGETEFPQSGFYNEGFKFTQAESDEKIRQKFNHLLKGVVMKRFNEYYDDNEIEEKFIVLLKNTTTSRAYWCWCGLSPDSEEEKNFIPDPNNTHFNVYYQVSIEPKVEMDVVGEMEMFDKFTV